MKIILSALMLILFAISAIAINVPLVAADYCFNSETIIKEINISGEYINITKPCSFGCDSMLHKCNEEFFIPVNFYFLFEIMALLILFGGIFSTFKENSSENEASPIPLLPVLATILFFVLSIGTVHLFIVFINYFFGIVSLFISIFCFFLVARVEAQKGIGKKDI